MTEKRGSLFFGDSSEFHILLQVLTSASRTTAVEVRFDVMVAEHADLGRMSPSATRRH